MFTILICGVGGVRTLVQTTSFQAFYMLSSWLVFDMRPDKNTQRAYLGFLVSCCGKTIGNTNPIGWTSERWTERVVVHQKYLSDLLYFGQIKPINIQLIKQQVRMTYCHLLFVAFDLRGTLQASACWHLTTAIAVKSNVDPKERWYKDTKKLEHSFRSLENGWM